MTPLTALLLPALIAAVIVFVVSSIIHMATPWHRSDYNKLPNEDAVMAALRPFNIPPGDYMTPRPDSMQDMKSPEFAEKRAKGPVMIATVMPSGPFTMGKTMAAWFVYLIIVGLFAGWVAASALAPGSTYRQVFHFVGIVAFVGYTLAMWPMSIWYRRSVITTIKMTIDGLLFALLTAGTFGWLWPK